MNNTPLLKLLRFLSICTFVFVTMIISCNNGETDGSLILREGPYTENEYFAIIPTCLPNCSEADKRKEYQKSKIRQAILRLIASAKKNIDIGAFNFSILELFHALVKKIEQDGVHVRILFPEMRLSKDALGSSCIKDTLEKQEFKNRRILDRAKYLRETCSTEYSKLNQLEVMYFVMNGVNGVQVKPFGSKIGGLYHHKMIIVDGKNAIFGSGNFSYNGLGFNLEEFTLLSNTEAPLISKFSCEFDSLFNNVSKNCGNSDIIFTPGTSSIRKLIEAKIKSAKKEVLVFVHKFDLDSIIKLLEKASKNGVKIKWLRSGEYCNNDEFDKMSKLVSNNFEVRYFLGNTQLSQFAHAKFAIFDSEQLIFGSGNWSLPAFDKNNEYYLTDSFRIKKIESLKKMFETVWDKYSTGLQECKNR